MIGSGNKIGCKRDVNKGWEVKLSVVKTDVWKLIQSWLYAVTQYAIHVVAKYCKEKDWLHFHRKGSQTAGYPNYCRSVRQRRLSNSCPFCFRWVSTKQQEYGPERGSAGEKGCMQNMEVKVSG